MHCPCCGYANLDNPLVCGLCGQVFRKVQAAVAISAPPEAYAPPPPAFPRPAPPGAAHTACEAQIQGGKTLVGLGVLALGCGLMAHMASDVFGDGAAPLLQYAAALAFIGLGVASILGSRISFQIGFWLYAIDTAVFAVVVLASGAVALVGGIAVRAGLLAWLYGRYRLV